MNNDFLRRIILNRKVSIFLVLLLMLFGAYNYLLLPKQENPQIVPPVAKISAVYPGASAEDIEKLITIKIEDELRGIPGYDYMESYSQNSISTTVLWLINGSDVDEAWEKLRQKMKNIQDDLPEGCQEIMIDTELDKTAGFILSISGKSYSYDQLALYANILKQELAGQNGLSKIEIKGEPQKQYQVLVDTGYLNRSSISLNDLVERIKAENLALPLGSVNLQNQEITVNSGGSLKNIDDLKTLIIGVSADDGSTLQLQDIARIVVKNKENETQIRQNGENAVLLVGYFQDGINILNCGKELKLCINNVKDSFPADLELKEILYQPTDIQASINDLMINLLQGIFFVIMVIYLGLGLRNALVVSLVIPLSVLITFSMMNLFNIELHQIAIAGLIISLGMLVDNAIVISDAIQVRLDRGEESLLACAEGARDVLIPVLTATLTTIAAYVPLLILPGVAGEYIRSIPQIVIIALSSSYLVAVFFTPIAAFLFLKKKDMTQKRKYFWDLVKRIPQVAINRKKTSILLIGMIFIFALFAASSLKLVFFPKADKQIIYMDLRSEFAEDFNKTLELAGITNEILSEQPEIKEITSSIGESLPKFFVTLPSPQQGSDIAQTLIAVDLKRGKRFSTNTEFVEYLQGIFDAKITQGKVKVKELEQAEPVEAPIVVRVSGSDRVEMQKAAGQIQALLKDIPGTVNVGNDEGNREYQYSIDIDPIRAAYSGLTKFDIQNELNIALDGRIASKILTDSGLEQEIVIQADIQSIDQLKNFGVKSSIMIQKTVLKQFADFELTPKYTMIKRYERAKTITVTADVQYGHSAVDIEEKLKREVEKIDHQEIKIAYDGENNKINKYFGDLGIAAFFAALAIYFIMLIQFNSLLQPLIILITIPLSLIGSVFGLLIFKQPLSFTALLGAVSLIGIVINNAIILVDYINRHRKTGEDHSRSCLLAVEMRTRPIILTTGTTILGLIPLLSSGTLFVPMAVALISGLLVSALLTLMVIPIVYMVLEK